MLEVTGSSDETDAEEMVVTEDWNDIEIKLIHGNAKENIDEDGVIKGQVKKRTLTMR